MRGWIDPPSRIMFRWVIVRVIINGAVILVMMTRGTGKGGGWGFEGPAWDMHHCIHDTSVAYPVIRIDTFSSRKRIDPPSLATTRLDTFPSRKRIDPPSSATTRIDTLRGRKRVDLPSSATTRIDTFPVSCLPC